MDSEQAHINLISLKMYNISFWKIHFKLMQPFYPGHSELTLDFMNIFMIMSIDCYHYFENLHWLFLYVPNH